MVGQLRPALKFFLLCLGIFSIQNAFSSTQDNSVTLYVIPPPNKLSWDSPRDITKTALLSSLNSGFHPIGHVTVKVECSFKGQNISFWTGMTSSVDNPSDNDLLLRDKLGLGIFYYAYQGYLESGAEIQTDVLKAKEEINRLFTLKFLINDQHCERIQNYFNEYKANQVDKIYGLVYRPRFREGAGCTAYAVSFLEVAGLMEAEFLLYWSKNVRVPTDLIGDVGKEIPITQLLTASLSSRWAKENEDHRKLHFYDTSFFYEWAKDINKLKRLPAGISRDEEAKNEWHKYVRTKKPAPGRDPDRHLTRSNGFFGLIIDRREWIASDEPLWFK